MKAAGPLNILEESPLLTSLDTLKTAPLNIRPILEELSRVLHADGSWSRAEVFQTGKILLEQKKRIIHV